MLLCCMSLISCGFETNTKESALMALLRGCKLLKKFENWNLKVFRKEGTYKLRNVHFSADIFHQIMILVKLGRIS